MKKRTIKTLSVLLAVVISLTAAPLSGLAGFDLPDLFNYSIGAKAVSDEMANAETVISDTTYTVEIQDYEGTYVKFVPSESGTFIITSDKTIEDGYGDPRVYLFDSYGDYISENDDGGEDNNFRLIFNVTKDTEYYIYLNSYGDSAKYTYIINEYVIPTSGTCGENATWEFDEETGTLTISGTGEMDYDSAPWYDWKGFIKSVIINEGITSVYDEAFSNCNSLASVTITDSVTTIGDYAFYDCNSLASVTIPDSVTTIGDGAFYDCDSLASVAIPDGVTTIGDYAFEDCNSLTSVTIPDSVTTIGEYAFKNCHSLTGITVDNNNEYYSSDEYGVLFNKDKTILIQYPAGNLRKSYTIPDSVTTINSYAFNECDNLASIIISDGVTTIGDFAFFSCDYFTSITIPDNVITIGMYAFYDCDSLTSITIPDSVTEIGYEAFKYSNSLTDITVDSNNEYFSSDEYGVLFNKDKTMLIQYPAGNTRTSYTIPDSVITIYESAFHYCYYLTDVIIGNCVTTIDSQAFYNCDRLTSITIPDSVTTIGSYAFEYCDYLNTVIIGSNVEYIGYDIFDDCDNLWHIYYKGSEEQWNNISIDGNYVLFNTTRHYNADGSEFEEAVIKEPWCYENGEAELHCTLCDNKSIVYTPDLGHSGAFIKTVAPTCDNEGYDLYKCDRCGENYERNWVNNLGHTGGTFVKTVAPTCDSNGYDLYKGCTNCGGNYQTNWVDCLGHQGTFIETVAPTCESIGYDLYKCSVCGYNYRTNGVDSLGHTGGTFVETVAPTCDYDGYDLYKGCTNCSENYQTNWVDCLGHQGTFIKTVAPACESSGYDLYKCNVCGDNYKINWIDSLGHTGGTFVKTYEPTCNYDGYDLYKGCTNCGENYQTNWVSCLGHQGTFIKTVEPTCENGGYDLYKCNVCGYNYEINWINSLGHTGGTLVKTVAPTCNSEGYDYFEGCAACGENYYGNWVEPLGHSGGTYVKTIEPSCYNSGYDLYENCANCGGHYGINWTSLPHDGTLIETVEVTCENDGYDIYLCNRCGEKYKNNYVYCSGHTGGTFVETVAPTCNNYGYDLYSDCSQCGNYYETNYVNSLEHDYVFIETVAPTCDEWGYDLYECKNCGCYYDANYVYYLGHTGGTYVGTVAPTCNSEGYDAYENCTRCGEDYNINWVSSLGHTQGKFVSTIEPSCKDYGYDIYECSVCGDNFKTNSLPNTGHYYVNNVCKYCGAVLGNVCEHDFSLWVVEVKPTCTENGVQARTCVMCGFRETEEIMTYGHNYILDEKVPTCTEDGYTSYTCKTCGDSYGESEPATGHEYVSFVNAPTCTENGYTTYICKTCGDTYVADEVPASHTAGEWEVVVEATYETEGTKIQKCTVCGMTVSEEIIPKIVRVTVDDEDTDVSIEFDSDEYNGEVEVVVEESFDGTAFDIIDTTLNTSQKVMYDITMTVDGVETQPNGKITVRIPLPEGYNPNRSFVYHIDTVNGKVEKMPAKYENGYLVFETTHFSYYAVVEEKDLTNAPTIEVIQKGSAITGKQVQVAISLKNNPGITSMLLKVNYDTSKLELDSVNDSGKLGSSVHSNTLGNPYTLCWANDTATENITFNGEVVVLTFNVLENAELGETPVTVNYNFGNADIIDKDMQPVRFEVVNGTVEIIDVIIGDVNNDSKINQLDRVMLTRYIANWEGYTEENVNLDAADVNCDGKINQLDRVILTRYVANWEGYETLPYTK